MLWHVIGMKDNLPIAWDLDVKRTSSRSTSKQVMPKYVKSLSEHAEAWTKWLPFCRRRYIYIFGNKTCLFQYAFHWSFLLRGQLPILRSQQWFKFLFGIERRRAITWISTNQNLCRWMASMGHKDLWKTIRARLNIYALGPGWVEFCCGKVPGNFINIIQR